MREVFAFVACAFVGAVAVGCQGAKAPRPAPPAAARAAASPDDSPAAWRKAHKLVDLHVHIEPLPERLERAVRIFDAVGVGLAVNLSGGTVTHPPGEKSAFETGKRLADERH